MRIQGLGLGALAAGALVVLAGCSGSATPSSSSPSMSQTSSASGSGSASGSSTPSGSATPVAVVIPEEAKAHTPEGGIAFATFAVMEGSRALSSNEPAGFLSLTLPDCRGCQAIPHAVKAQLAADRWSATPRAVVTGAQLAAPESPQGLEIDVQGVEVAATLINAKGTVVAQSPEQPLSMRLAIAWTEDGWKVADVVAITS